MKHKAVVTKYKSDKFCISIYINGARFRFYTGEAIGIKSNPNRLPLKKREEAFEDLLLDYKLALRQGWIPEVKVEEEKKLPEVLTLEHLQSVVQKKIQENCSNKYIQDLKFYIRGISKFCTNGEFSEEAITKFINSKTHWSNTSYNNARRYIGVIEQGLREFGYAGNWKENNKPRKAVQKLHKPFDDVEAVLEDIYKFNPKLHLCCILTYGCLLRPHQEIRNLCWGDFSADFTRVSLSGSRTKGKRNRVIPISDYIKPFLNGGPHNHNIFSDSDIPHNPDYFKTLWSRYKEYSTIIQEYHTLYSFRHTGAIKVYEKTGSLTMLQRVMGHADLKTSLTYLRGLEIAELEETYMPKIS